MSFFKEVSDSLVSLLGRVPGGYTLIGYGGGALYLEGVKRVLSIDSTLMRFDCGKKKLAVGGSDMRVSELEDGCVTVTGRIVSVSEEEQS